MSEIPDAGGPVASSDQVRASPEAGPEVPDAEVRHPVVRQPVVRVRGARRARLMPAPGTTAEPAPADDPHRGATAGPTASGPNDDRMLRDVPPHY